MRNEIGTSTCSTGIAFALIAAAPANAFALDVEPPPAKPTATQRQSAKEPNTATLRPIAIRLEGTLSLLSYYSVGITAGYAFHRRFALEGTAAWEGGLTHGMMGRFRIPVTSWASISLGIGASVLWVPWKGEHNGPGVYMWLPGEIGWEFRQKDGFTILVGLSTRVLIHAPRVAPDPLCLCLDEVPKVYPAARVGIGWAF